MYKWVLDRFNFLMLFLTISISAYILSNVAIIWINYALLSPSVEVIFPPSKKGSSLSHNLKYNYQEIITRNLFGGIVSPSIKSLVSAHPRLVDIPVVKSLEIRLKGIVWAPVSYLRAAIIEDKKTRKEDIYREGEEVKKGIFIKRIMKNQIVISVNGKDRRVLLEGTQRLSGNNRILSRVENVVIDRKLVMHAVSNLGEIVRDINLIPYSDKYGKGFKISYLRPSSLFAKVGLRRGDIILRINGNDVTNINKLLSLYDKLLQTKIVRLNIVRNGINSTIICRFR